MRELTPFQIVLFFRGISTFGKADPSLNQLRLPFHTESAFLQNPDDFVYVRLTIVKGDDEDLTGRVVIDAQEPFNRFQGHTYPGLLRSGLASRDAELRLSLRREGRRHKSEGHQQTPEQHKHGNISRSGEPPFFCYHNLSYPQSSMRTSVHRPIMLLTQSSLSLIHCRASALEI